MTRPRICSLFIIWLFCVATVIASPAQSVFFTTLASFNGTDGSEAEAGLLQASDGNFYGTTYYGGANSASFCTQGCGTIFKLTPAGTLATLYSFCSEPNCTDGWGPTAGVVQARDGSLYGTTYYGGTIGSCYDGGGCGTVFKITLSGTLTTLYRFCSHTNCPDGADPFGGLAQGVDGNFYGTTEWGGAIGTGGVGTAFRITPSGTLTTLYNFCSQQNCTDGDNPKGTLVQGSDGNFYGTTYWGGADENCWGEFYNCGTVFKITPDGVLTILHSFNGSDGGNPIAGVVLAADGNFYGTTSQGGTSRTPSGTVFKITPSGTLTSLYSFDEEDGFNPVAGLAQGTDENFYGTTLQGGTGAACPGSGIGCGTAFKITPTGLLTTLYNFCSQPNCADGVAPYGGLTPARNGNLYGTTGFGGTYSVGTIFRIDEVRSCATCRP